MSAPTRPAADACRILETIETSQRGPLANVVYHTARVGAPPYGHASDAPWTPETLRLAVMADLTARLRRAFRHGIDGQYAKLAGWIATFNADEAATRDFCAYVLWRESLPPDERASLKAERGEEHRRSFQDQQPPTAKQLTFLRHLGYSGTPRSKAHASELIDGLLKARVA